MEKDNKKKKRKKREKWMKFRHKVVRGMLWIFIKPLAVAMYGIKIDKFKEEGKRPYLILYNHQTAFDQFFVGLAFKQPVYYVASEDLFSNGFVSSLIRWLVAPIPIKKQATDVAAVMNCIRLAKEGGTLAIAPEGNRTYSGKTEYIAPSIATLAKKIKLPIAIYRIEGGYGVQPRWSDKTRKGNMHSYVSKVIEPEEYSTMSNEELHSLIEKELYVNEGIADAIFTSGKKAEYLERAMYVCPYCGLSEFESNGNEIECKKCHRKLIYGEDKTLTGVGFDFPYKFVTEWYEAQKEYVCGLDLQPYYEKSMYTDKAKLSEVIVYKRKDVLREDSEIKLYGNRIVVDESKESSLVLPFDEVSAISVLGRNKVNIYHDKHVYQLKSDKRFNALRYVNMFYHYKNISKGETNEQFLGL
jgi:1-acyl-sn-glycerol-3-phosphate acyltransferase